MRLVGRHRTVSVSAVSAGGGHRPREVEVRYGAMCRVQISSAMAVVVPDGTWEIAMSMGVSVFTEVLRGQSLGGENPQRIIALLPTEVPSTERIGGDPGRQ
jgi:hypothetical protein